MNAQDLKNSILQLAIQGKLVEQRKEEGTTKELLDQIKAEKEQLIKEGKIKKEKPLAEVTEEEIPFEIPESWEWVRLGDLINIASGKGLTSKSMQEGTIPVFGGNGITGYHNTGNVYEETVVIGRVGFYCGSVHVTPEIAWVTDNAFITTYPKRSIYRDYLVYILRHLNLGKSNNATAQPVVSGKKIYPLLFPLPPLEEQKRIVAKIEELMPYVEKYGEAHSKLKEFNKKFPEDMQKSILQYAIKGKLVEQRKEEGTAEELYQQIQEEKARLIKEGNIKKEKPLAEITEDEIPFDIPESWKWVRLGEMGFTNIGLTYKPTSISDKGTIVLRSSNISNGKLIYDDIVKVEMTIPENKMCKKGDILICARNGSKRLVGKAAIIDKDDMSFGAFMAIFRSICNQYILYVINSAYFRNSLLPETGTTTINQITQETLRNFLLPLPPLEEQKRIVAKIEEILPYCQQLVK